MRHLQKILTMDVDTIQENSSVYSPDILALISNEHAIVQDLIDNKKTVYGANTLVGHKDSEQSTPSNLLNEVLTSHLIGFGDAYSLREIDFVIKAKIMAWQAGGTGISLATYLLFCRTATAIKTSVYVPKGCSYSSGDVIPATHLLNGFLRTSGCLNFPCTDIMPFINGNFIQIGYSLSLLSSIDSIWMSFCRNSASTITIAKANRSNFHIRPNTPPKIEGLLSLFSDLTGLDKAIQDPISIRATPQYLINFFNETQRYLTVLNDSISVPSGNPLFSKNYTESVSQSSFLALDLSGALLSMINAVNMILSVVINRTTYLLSGKDKRIPQDASMYADDLALIQIPKLLMSIDEKVRLKMPAASAYSAKSTSWGVEDMWNNGLILAGTLSDLIKDVDDALIIERYVHLYLANSIPSIASDLDLLSIITRPSNDFDSLNYVSSQKSPAFIGESLRDFVNKNRFNPDLSNEINHDIFSDYSITNRILFDCDDTV